MLKVLVVDDDKFVRMSVSSLLEKAGYSASQATDGEDALKKLEEVSPDVMVLDLMMPKMDGFEVYRRMRMSDKWKNLPVVICSARSPAYLGDIERGLLAGIRGYVTKPNVELLLVRLKEVLDGVNGKFAIL